MNGNGISSKTRPRFDQLEINGASVKVGSRVRLHPKEGGDILDIALRGQVAIIESIEEDYEGVRHVCVVLEDDPGRDLGMMRQPGHRFFFTPAELEPLLDSPHTPSESSTISKPIKHEILVAGIGNIFLGDDGFGVEVVRRLMQRALPRSVRVIDFGVRGLDLAYALQDGYKTTILIDAFPSWANARDRVGRRARCERIYRRANKLCRTPRHASDERAPHGERDEWPSESSPARRL